MTTGGTKVRKLSEDEQDRLKDDLAALYDAVDEHGFVFRIQLDDATQAAVEPLLYGAARLHVFPNEMLGKSSPRMYEYEQGLQAIFALAIVTPDADPDWEPAGWRRRYTDADGWTKAARD